MAKKNHSESSESESQYQVSPPNPDLKSLDRLIGTWTHSGGAEGKTTYEWMEGGYFLVQRVELQQYGQEIRGVEYIGHVQPFGEEPSKDIKSRFYSFLDGMTLDYVYELEGDTLMIWAGERGSPAYYKGKFSKDGNTITGEWIIPEGGGYQSTATRVK